MRQARTYAQLLADDWTPGRIRQAVKEGRLRRLTRGVYAPAGTDDPLGDRVAALQVLWPTAAASHQTAALLHGFGDPLAVTPTHLTVGHDAPMRPGPGLELHRTTRSLAVVRRRGLVFTDARQTVLDLARWLPFLAATALADAAVEAGVCTTAGLAYGLPSVHHLPGARRARRVVAACRAGAQSPMETRTRLLLTARGVPEPVLQYPITTRYGVLHVDMAWPEGRVALEYDGRVAHGDGAFVIDRHRWRALAESGWDVHPVSAVDLRTPDRLALDVIRALRCRGAS